MRTLTRVLVAICIAQGICLAQPIRLETRAELLSIKSGTATDTKQYVVSSEALREFKANESWTLKELRYVEIAIGATRRDKTIVPATYDLETVVTFSPHDTRKQDEDSKLGADEIANKNQDVGYGDDFGVVNLIDCQHVTINGLKASNRRQYQPTPSTLRYQASCALNVARSTDITLEDCHFKGLGKSVVLVHGNSEVAMNGCSIAGFYFELNVGASDVSINDGVLIQELANDSHAAINATSSYALLNGNKASRNSDVDLTNVTFRMKSGRAIVTGNTNNPEFVSMIRLTDPHFQFRGPPQHSAYGLVGYSKSWHSINLEIDGGDVVTDYTIIDPITRRPAWMGRKSRAIQLGAVAPIGDPNGERGVRLRDFVTTRNPAHAAIHPTTGFGRFVHYAALLDGFIAMPRFNSNVKDPRAKEHRLPKDNLVSDGFDGSFDPNEQPFG